MESLGNLSLAPPIAIFQRQIFEISGYDNIVVNDTTTADYFAGMSGIAPRPLNSDMSLEKIQSTGFSSNDWQEELKHYLEKELSQ